MIYLDNAATTYPKPERVYKALDAANRKQAFNAGRGSYKVAKECSKLIDDAKRAILKLFHGRGIESVVFTPSITIALNEILNGITFIKGDYIFLSPYEHNAIVRTANQVCKRTGAIIELLPVKEDTLEIDIEKTKYLFASKTPKCVCCTAISNVTGYILPYSEVFSVAKNYKAITVLDTAQALGLIDIDITKCKVDFAAFAGHKALYGPLGIGGFVDVNNIPLKEFIVGGTGSDSLNLEMPLESPYKYESASPNIVAVAGLMAAIEEVRLGTENIPEKVLLEYLIDKFADNEKITMYLPPKDKRIGILSFNLEGYKAEDVGLILDEDFDIAVRTGYHCAPFVHDILEDKKSLGTVRVGIGRYNFQKDIDVLVDAIRELSE